MYQKQICLSIYGKKICVLSHNTSILEEIGRDFSFFVSHNDETPHFTVWAYLANPSRKKPHPFHLLMKTREFTCYEIGKVKHVYYSFDDYVRHDYQNNVAAVYSEDLNRLHELVYVLLLSKIGELMEEIGFHRIHAFGFSYQGKGVLFLSPLGGGKTTLALSLLKSFPIRILSDDTPLLDSQCNLHPFPLRIGVRTNEHTFLYNDHPSVRYFKRRRYGEKALIDIDFFKGKIEKNPVRLCFVFIGRIANSGEEECSIRETNRLILLHALVNNLVLGLGTAQVKEYFIKRSLLDFCKKISIVLKRFSLCSKIVLKYRPFIVTLGNDSDDNASTMVDFLKRFLASRTKGTFTPRCGVIKNNKFS